jgi:small conductance mechanosensitive channel
MFELFGITIQDKFVYAILLIVGGYLLYKILITVVNKSFSIRMKKFKVDGRRQKTVNILLNNIIKYTFVIIILFAVLGVLGVNAGAIIASIGVVGLAIGLAVQDILKDIIAGMFILIENQYAIGDVVMIGNFKGEVIFLGLKSTKLKSETGEIKILSNRNITDITNYSLHNSNIYIDVDLKYDNDVVLVEKVLIDLATKLSKTINNIKGDFKYLGIQKMGDKITYRLSVESDIKYHEDIKRQVWRELKKELDKKEIR